MKKNLLITLIGAATLLSACGKESEFKSAINKSIETDYNCLNLSSSGFVPWMDNKELEQYKKENSFVLVDVEKNGKIDQSSSYDTDNSNKAIGSWDRKPIKGTMFIINFYNLTDSGKQTVKEKHFSGLFGSGDQKYTFCYTHPQVDSILNFTEQELGGQHIVQVKYSYKYVDIADWVNKTEIKAAFPEIDKSLNKPDKTTTTGLIKTNNGWQTNL
jgi:hypothetical protein